MAAGEQAREPSCKEDGSLGRLSTCHVRREPWPKKGVGTVGMGGAQPGQQPDMGKIFAAEAENLQLVEHAWFLDGAEERLLKGNQRAALAADKKKN